MYNIIDFLRTFVEDGLFQMEIYAPQVPMVSQLLCFIDCSSTIRTEIVGGQQELTTSPSHPLLQPGSVLALSSRMSTEDCRGTARTTGVFHPLLHATGAGRP